MEKPNADAPDPRIRPGVILTVTAIVGLLIAGKLLGWFGSHPTTADGTDGASSTTDATAPATTEHSGPATAGPTTPRATRPGANPGVDPQMPALATAPNATTTPPGTAPLPGERLKEGEWEQRLDDILAATDDEPIKATKLLEMFPLLPEDGQVEVAQHISNLLPDDRYAALSQTFTNATTPEPVLDVLMTDVLNRGNAIKLSTLLQIARTPDHPKAGEAKDVLEVFVDEDYGTDWAKWDKAIQDWLKENPDEPAEVVGK